MNKMYIFHNHHGSEHINKLLLVVTVFVAATIMLAVITQALKGPLKTWFDDITKSWFNDGSNFMSHGADMNATSTYNYSDDGGGCLIAGTQIKMADGTLKNIEDIVIGDMVMAYDHEAGCFVSSAIHYVFKGEDIRYAFSLVFSDGVKLTVVSDHAFFEQESLRYVTILADNATEYIGKHFYSAESGSYVELTDVVYESEPQEYYAIYSSHTLNTIANGILNVTADASYLINIYSFREDLSIDTDALKYDIETYGLDSFEAKEYSGMTKEEYEAWNAKYLSVAIGKGLITAEKAQQQNIDAYGE